MTKTCRKCGTEKDEMLFCKTGDRKNLCKVCFNNHQTAYRANINKKARHSYTFSLDGHIIKGNLKNHHRGKGSNG